MWDADSGLEFANDLIANVTEYVIPCSVMDSIDEPRTAWKEGELDPIAIKSDGGCWVMFFSILFSRMFYFFSANLWQCIVQTNLVVLTLVSHAGNMAVPWRRQVKNGYVKYLLYMLVVPVM